MPMATQHGRVVTHNEKLPPILSYDPSIAWSCEVTCQIKCYIFNCTRPMETKHSKVVRP